MRFFTLLLLLFCGKAFTQNNWYTFPNNTPDNSIRYIYIDSNDTKWIGTFFNGLHRYNNGAWKQYTRGTVADNDVRQSCFDGRQNLWVATWNGLSKFDTVAKTWTTLKVKPTLPDILTSVQADLANRIWVGTDGGDQAEDGLYMFDGSRWTFYHPQNSPLQARWITALEKDRNGQVWGCAKHLFSIEDTVVVNRPIAIPGWNPQSYPTCLATDSRNNKWVGFYNGGLAKFDGGKWTVYTTENSALPDDSIWSLAIDLDDKVWIGTETKGLVRFDGRSWTVFNNQNSPLVRNRVNALAVDKTGNLWINAGGLAVFNENGIARVKGKVYLDKNSDGKWNAGEPPVANQVIGISPGGYFAISDSSGHYETAILSGGDFLVKPKISLPYVLNTRPTDTTITISDRLGLYDAVNFAVTLQENVHDNAIDLTSRQPARPGFPFSYQLTTKNLGSVRSDSIAIQLTHDPRLALDSVSVPLASRSNQTLTWKLDSLGLLDQRRIMAYFHLAPSAVLATLLESRATIMDRYTDQDTLNNKVSVKDTIRGSFDPNDKTVFPAGEGIFGDIPPGTSELTYLVRFQNTGTDTAFMVVIRDTLSSTLDVSSLEIVSASHAYKPEIKKGKFLAFHFTNILLPDSNRNEPASHGFIKFRIRLAENLAVGTEIRNKAAIYFDFNEPVITNETRNRLHVVTSVEDPVVAQAANVQVYPNPSQTAVLIKPLAFGNRQWHLVVTNLAGQVVFSKEKITQNHYMLPMGGLQKGIYFFRITAGHKTMAGRFIRL